MHADYQPCSQAADTFFVAVAYAEHNSQISRLLCGCRSGDHKYLVKSLYSMITFRIRNKQDGDTFFFVAVCIDDSPRVASLPHHLTQGGNRREASSLRRGRRTTDKATDEGRMRPSPRKIANYLGDSSKRRDRPVRLPIRPAPIRPPSTSGSLRSQVSDSFYVHGVHLGYVPSGRPISHLMRVLT